MASVPRQIVLLETSSYLPLVWRTPYTKSIVEKLHELAADCDFAIQADCIREAAGYLSFEEDWKYHCPMRIRRLLEKLSDDELGSMGFPSTAVQILLGGNIWPQGKYLNFVRHSAFLFSDLLDTIDFHGPRAGLSELASRMDHRVASFRQLFRQHEASREISLPLAEILPYWGKWYLLSEVSGWPVSVLQDHRAYAPERDLTRDAFHYDFSLRLSPQPRAILVADTGFQRQMRKSVGSLEVPIICATTSSAAFYG